MRQLTSTIKTILFVLLASSLIFAECSQFQLTFVLPKFNHLPIFISSIGETLQVQLTLNISYLQSSSSSDTSIILIYSTTFVQTDQLFKYSIWNFQNSDQSIVISISAPTISNLSQNILTIGAMKQEALFMAAFDKDTSSGYMLPFNMFNQKIRQFAIIAHNATVQQITYNLQPFMSTYWTEIQSSIEILPHFPYLSQCSLQKPYILLNDLIQPQSCLIDDLYGVLCDDKYTNFNCIIEQLEVSNVDAQFWFNKDKKILFYLFEKKLSMDEFNQITQELLQVNTLILNQFSNLVPVLYYRYSTDQVIVNQYNINFQISIDEDSSMRIVQAQIQGYFNQDIAAPNALVHIRVSYLSIYQKFNSYDLQVYWYIAYALLIDVIFITCIWLFTSKFCAIELKQKIQNILSPAIKGCIYTLITGGLFFILLNEIAYQTSFSGITALFGSTLTNQNLELNNIGRNGVIIGFIGLYLLITVLKQAFKVSSSSQLKFVFEDDSKFDKKKPLSEDELQQKIEFTKKNMVSHKKFLLVASLFIIFLDFFFIQIVFSCSNYQIAMISLFLAPFTTKFFCEQMKYTIMKQLLYMTGHFLSLVITFSFLILKNQSLYSFTYLYFCRFVNLYIEVYIVEIAFDYGIKKIDESSQANRFLKFISQILRPIIDFKRSQSEYERALYLSSIIIMELLGVLLMPLIFLSIFLIGRNGIFATELLIEDEAMAYSIVMMIILMPLEIYTIFALIQLLKKNTGYRIEEVIKFNRFKFKRRKFRWMNDEFSHSKNINYFYREYEKFAFSSQLYFIISLLGYSTFLINVSLIIIIESSYLFGNDPAVLVMLIVVIIVGDVLSIVFSFAAVKLKLYEKKEQQAMRQNLIKTDKYLKNNDMTQFLELQGVKEYFLQYNKDWIIKNLHCIFEKQDFEQNNGELIAKYKHYKSIFKKREIQQKRRMKKLKENLIINNSAVKVVVNKIILNKKEFNLLTKPIMYYWFYLSKQNIYLKNIINCVKKEKIKKNCEFCNMDIELEALERKDFQELTNEFRVLNVNKAFDAQSFLEFYRLNQKYITICIECKQKNLHLENKITMKEISSKLVKRWFFIAKSSLLHKRASK